MINGLEGIPGSGKSYESVVMHVLPSLKAGRKVITNLPLLVPMFNALDPAYGPLIELRTKSQPILGIWDAEAMGESGAGTAFCLTDTVNFEVIKNVPIFGSVWDYYTPWKHPTTGSGPLFVIDEAHLALPVSGTRDEVIEWYKLHRHFNADVLLATQSFRDVNQPIARLLAMLIRCRKADILGKKDSYIRKVHAGYRGAVISAEERKYEPQFFGLYRSHTQGNSVVESMAADVMPLSVKLKRFTRGFWFFTLIVAVAAAIWYAQRKPLMPANASRPAAAVQAGPAAVVAAAPGAAAPRPSASSAVAPGLAVVPVVVDLEPFKDKGLHITGWLTVAGKTLHTFAVSSGGVRLFDMRTPDLIASGYTWKPMSDCVGYLTWEQKTRAVMCDSPKIAIGSGDAPVVVDGGTGRRSDAAPSSPRF